MKRDMDLIREILFEIESRKLVYPRSHEVILEGYKRSDISYHVLIMQEAGLLRAIEVSTADELVLHPSRLTWEGHEFLEAIKDDGIWNQAKDVVLEKGGGLVFDVLQAVLVQIIKNAVLSELT